MYKAVALLCASAFIQSISAQCIRGPCEGIGLYGPTTLAASSGPGLAITSVSPISPTGVYVTSENCYEGPLNICGAIPFLGAVALDGTLPTCGDGAVRYGCGDGNVAILSEDIPAPYAYAPYAAPNGYAGSYGYGSCGCGCAGPRF